MKNEHLTLMAILKRDIRRRRRREALGEALTALVAIGSAVALVALLYAISAWGNRP